jgi:hypothetical protein
MGLLDRIAPHIRKGLSPSAVRLLTGEPEPELPIIMTDRAQVPAENYTLAAKKQVSQRIKARRKAKTRG